VSSPTPKPSPCRHRPLNGQYPSLGTGIISCFPRSIFTEGYRFSSRLVSSAPPLHTPSRTAAPKMNPCRQGPARATAAPEKGKKPQKKMARVCLPRVLLGGPSNLRQAKQTLTADTTDKANPQQSKPSQPTQQTRQTLSRANPQSRHIGGRQSKEESSGGKPNQTKPGTRPHHLKERCTKSTPSIFRTRQKNTTHRSRKLPNTHTHKNGIS
jgi:transcription initiation factor TFIID subunit TAF12